MVIITEDKLSRAMRELGYHPQSKHIRAMVKVTNEYFNDKYNAAMFLGQCAHESTGYADIEEVQYRGATQSCYGDGAPGKSYHGRGFIQLSWPSNYRNCSNDIGRGDELYYHPELVANDPYLGARVSVWYWKRVVEQYQGFNPRRKFGVSTRAINGSVECNGQHVDRSKNRYRCYLAVCNVMGIYDPADECGCYN